MEPNNEYPYEAGSVAEVVAHLALWCESVPDGLARVSYFAEAQRNEAIAQLQAQLTTEDILYHSLTPPKFPSAGELVGWLVNQLRELPASVVFVLWSSDVFPENKPVEDALRVLNFNRENLAQFPLRQIWWMPREIARAMMRTIPDLNSWFLMRLELEPGNVSFDLGQTPLTLSHNDGVFMVPLPRNPFFTGRDAILHQLHDALQNRQNVLLTQAISGLGGIGKTQTAAEYAYRYRGEYTHILWTQADSPTAIDAGYRVIARELQLPEMNAQNAEETRTAVKRWLETYPNYLLIFDNADAPDIVRPFLPTTPDGHILLTSRARSFGSLGNVTALRLNTLSDDEATDFLLERIYHRQATQAEREASARLAREVDGLPLALEQAAAYIIETQISLGAYLRLFQETRLQLLAKVGPVRSDYRESVLTTWKPNFDAVASASPESAELLRLSAFLSPDAIPFELLNDQQKDRELPILERYSLITIKRDDETYSIHRLVQEVIKAKMPSETRLTYAEKAVETVESAYPGSDFIYWPKLDRLLPQQAICVQHIEQFGLISESAARLLNQMAFYLKERASYSQAEPLLKLALDIFRALLPEGHLNIANILNNLAGIYQTQGRFTEAEPLLEQALVIKRTALPERHPDIAISLNNLAVLYESQSRSAEAELLFEQALEIDRMEIGEDHPDYATDLNNLAELYRSQSRNAEAESLHEQALAIRRAALPEGHPAIATSLNNLAGLYQAQGRYREAEPLYEQTIDIFLKALGPKHPNTTTSLNHYLSVLAAQGRQANGVAFIAARPGLKQSEQNANALGMSATSIPLLLSA